jgi:hypothetical protein
VSWWEDVETESRSGIPGRNGRSPSVCGAAEQTEFWFGGAAAGSSGDDRPGRARVVTEERSAPPRSSPGEVQPAARVADEAPADLDKTASSAEASDAPDPQRRGVPPRSNGNGAAPRFEMYRYLKLNGILDEGDEIERVMELPRRRFRPSIPLGVIRRFSIDFLKDLRPPPRSSGASPARSAARTLLF